MRIFLNFFIPLLLMPNFNSNYSCTEFYDIHPIRNEIGLQVLLKNNEYEKAKALQDKHPNVFYQLH